MAIKRILKKENRKNNKIRNLLALKPFDFGKGSKKLSKEVDKRVYA